MKKVLNFLFFVQKYESIMLDNVNNNADQYINSSLLDGNSIFLPEGPMYDDKGKKTGKNYPALEGKQSALHSLSVLHYNDFLKTGPKSNSSFTNTKERFFDGKLPTGYKNPSGSQIVSSFDETAVNHAMQYKWGDFLYLDSYGKVPNNHLITLRRFPQPCNDNLLSSIENPDRDVSRLLTYLDGEENTFSSVFSFSTGFNWKEFQSEIQQLDKSKTGWGGNSKIFSAAMGYTDTSGNYAREQLQGKAATDFNPYDTHRNNYVWGPIDVIDKIMTRDRGLKFNQDLSIKFKYAIRSFNGISTKVAFLDLVGNMLNMVTNKAPFWGGAVRMYGGGGHSGPLGDTKALRNGDIDGFLSSVLGGLSGKLSKPFEGGFLNGLKTIAGNAGAGLLGGSLDKLGRPEMFSIHSLLTGTPTGEWHLTIGNPFNPTMMLGNLIMEDANWGFEGPFTADDVPSFITLEIKLKHAMPRDKYAIQKMFNFGVGRFYGSNMDFVNKSYYRNRDLGGSGGKGKNTALIMANQIQDTSTGDRESKTANTAVNKYQSLYASIASA